MYSTGCWIHTILVRESQIMFPSRCNRRTVVIVKDISVQIRQQHSPVSTGLHPSARMDLMRDERCPDWHVLHITSDDGSLQSNAAAVFVAQEAQAVRELIVDDVTFEHDFLPTEIPVLDCTQGLTVVLGTEGEEGAEVEDELFVAAETETAP